MSPVSRLQLRRRKDALKLEALRMQLKAGVDALERATSSRSTKPTLTIILSGWQAKHHNSDESDCGDKPGHDARCRRCGVYFTSFTPVTASRFL
jgi:hypothetical protein